MRDAMAADDSSLQRVRLRCHAAAVSLGAAGEALEDFDEDGLVGSTSSSSGSSSVTDVESSVSVETVEPGGEDLPESPSVGEPPTAATERPGETDSNTGQTDASSSP